MVTHQTSNGCNLNPGDLFGTGTISSDSTDGCGSLLELTQGGRQPITLPSGENGDSSRMVTRSFCVRGPVSRALPRSDLANAVAW